MINKVTKIQIGVMGGAFKYTKAAIDAAYKIGETIAQSGCVLITGATSGIPYAAALGANNNGGISIGISPASNAFEHVKIYKKPLDGYDSIIFSGMGYNGREPLLTSSCDGLIFIGGEFGTLIEFGQGYYNGKILGVLTGVGGVSDKIEDILLNMETKFGSKIIFNSRPINLIEELIKEIERRNINNPKILIKSKQLGNEVKRLIRDENK